ncbi:hypothetical protein [Microbacterium sp. NPDC056234]|uniref:hypothetical protein n=1 Tax=Microbacterium sp. NPDC056234 TaxID=3345757 RepID=UPI0035D92833
MVFAMRVELVGSLDNLAMQEPIDQSTMQQPIHTPYEYKKSKTYKLKVRTPLVSGGRTGKDSKLSPDKSGRDRTRREKTKEYQSRLLYQLLCKEGLDFMNSQVHRRHLPRPTWDELYEHLDEWTASGGFNEWTDEIGISCDYEIATGNVDGRGTLSFSKIDRSVLAATDFVLDVWDESYLPRKREQGRKGGMAFRKWDLAEYLDTYEMTAKQAAAALNVSVRTVFNMRKYFRDVFDMNTGEVFHDLSFLK